MKLINKSLLLTFILVSFFGCRDLEELNENPNEPNDVPPGVLMTSAQRDAMNSMVNESFLLGNNVAQLSAKTLRTEVDDYTWNAFPTVWEALYLSLADLEDARRRSAADGNASMEGAATVMQAWLYSTLTMAYGDIPYTEAIGGLNSENFRPVYDDQEFILNDLLENLDRANTLLSSNEGNITGDIILNNNPMMWRKLANSLRLRLLLHLSNKQDVSEEMQNIVSNEPYLSEIGEDAVLEYLNNFPNEFPLFPLKQGDFDAVVISDNVVSIFEGYGDPRLIEYARPNNINVIDTMPSVEPEFSGAENGNEFGDCNKNGSRLGTRYYDYPDQPIGDTRANGILMTHAETELILAEAALKGLISEDPETHYRRGIESSMMYYGVDFGSFGWNDFDDFYTNSGIAYSGDLDQIWEQKWAAIFFHGLEPFFETRRWHYEVNFNFDEIPFQEAPCENNNGDILPLRFLYPGEEQSLNAANYQDAVEKLGGSDNQNAVMWLMED